MLWDLSKGLKNEFEIDALVERAKFTFPLMWLFNISTLTNFRCKRVHQRFQFHYLLINRIKKLNRLFCFFDAFVISKYLSIWNFIFSVPCSGLKHSARMSSYKVKWPDIEPFLVLWTVNPLHNSTHNNSKILYNVILTSREWVYCSCLEMLGNNWRRCKESPLC